MMSLSLQFISTSLFEVRNRKDYYKGARVILRISEMLSNLTWMMVLWVYPYWWLIEYQFSSVAQSCLTVRPHGLQHTRLPFLSPTPEFTQTRVHWVSDAIQPSHPLSSLSSPAFNLSQHQGFFQWVSSLHQVSKVLMLQLQRHSFQWISKNDSLYDWLVWSLCSPRDSQESSPTPQFKSINCSALSFLYTPTLTPIHDYWKNHSFD